MAIHDEVAVGSLFVLAHARLDQRRVFHCRKAEGEIFTNALQRGWADDSLAVSGIESRAASVISHLEAAAIAVGDAVEETLAVIAPHGKLGVGET